MSFFGELKRRNVVKVAVAYAIVGWLLVQIADTFFPALQLPEWTVTFVAGLVILGFPLALILSWAYELTPDGMERTKSVPLSESITKVTGRNLDFVIIGLLVLGVGFMFVDNYVLVDSDQDTVAQDAAPADESAEESVVPVVQAEERDALPNSVAVLPLENLSPDPDNAYFAAGMHEEILNHLAKLRNLNVISRTSVVRYSDSDLSVPEIAAELNVETVMEGSVRYANDRVLVTIQLIDSGTDAHLWSESYNRDLSDIFAIQADIAMNVANALQAEFSVAEQESIEAVPTNSPDAYALYLRSVSLVGVGLRVRDARLQLLDGAISLDPNFALAYATKAYLSADVLTGNVPARQAELEQLVQDNAERALALDSTLGSAHAALAFVHQANWRWAEAEEEFEHALRLGPNDTAVLIPYSRLKRFQGEYAEAIQAGRRVAELDPNSGQNHYQLGINYRFARNHDAAAASFQVALEMIPGAANGHAQVGYTEVSRGNWTEAARELQLAETLLGDGIISMRLPQLANAYAQMGRRDDVERLSAALEIRAEDSPVNAALWALMYIALKDYDQALEWLEAAVDDQAPDLVTLGEIKANPYADPVLDEPRFQALRDRIGT